MFNKSKPQLTEDGKEINCMIIEPGRGRYLGHLDSPPGTKKNYGGQYLHFVRKDGEQVSAIEAPVGMENPPTKLFRFLHCWSQPGNILFTMKNTALEVARTLGLYVLAGVLVLAIYLLAQ